MLQASNTPIKQCSKQAMLQASNAHFKQKELFFWALICIQLKVVNFYYLASSNYRRPAPSGGLRKCGALGTYLGGNKEKKARGPKRRQKGPQMRGALVT